MTLKDKQHTKNNDWGVPTQMFYYQDVKEALEDWKMWNRACIRAGNMKTKEADTLFEILEKKYNCPRYELGFIKIFGDFEK